ncbi:MAG: membrane-bound lytic murein transglycosylase MltF [Halofilum sp. (in: g-proteobacteria)]
MVACAALLLGACDSYATNNDQKPSRSLAEIEKSGELVVLTRNAPTTRFIGRDGQPSGPEHDLATAFGAWLGVDVRFRYKDSVGALMDGLEDAEGDLAAAGLTITEERRDRFRFGPTYQSVTQQVACRRDNVQPEEVTDLVGLDLRVISDSSYVERLEALKANGHPELEWRAVEDATTESLLRGVWQREFDCTVADSTIVDLNRRYFPELISSMNLTREQSLGWVMPQERKDLARAVGRWLKQYRKDGGLDAVQDKYYGFFAEFDYVDIRRYIRRIDERFPRYRQWFREAAEQHDLPFTLVAAQGYQESHWRADAVSPTGVRGIMMLTLLTAKEMGVDNRLDARQSIFGGAKYLARLKRRFVEEVTEPDRTLLALAAYNVGRGHLHDAQVLARERDLSPHRWRDIRQVLPLLADPDHYNQLKYGYARGHEPVRYVRRIREYQHVLERERDE